MGSAQPLFVSTIIGIFPKLFNPNFYTHFFTAPIRGHGSDFDGFAFAGFLGYNFTFISYGYVFRVAARPLQRFVRFAGSRNFCF